MNRRIASFAIAAVAIAAAATAVFPQHAWSVVRVAAVAVAALAGAAVLAAVGAVTGRDPEVGALDRTPGRAAAPLDPHGLRDARRDLDRPRASGGIPRPVWERLRVAAVQALTERGLDLDNPRTRLHAPRALTPATWDLLATPPSTGGTADRAAVAAIVNRTLDELDALSTGARP